MKILEVIDSPWAIGALAQSIKDENAHLNIEIITIHPKEYRNNKEDFNELFTAKVKAFQPNVIHFHYWDTAKYLSELPVCEGIKKILTHHNQKNLLSHTWDKIDQLVVHTQKAKTILEKAGYWNVEVIQHGIDIEKFTFKEKLEQDNKLLGYVGRIVPWKGLANILKVAREFGTEVLMMGKIDKADYWKQCLEYSDVMDIRFGTPDKEQVKTYHEMSCYIGNSCDGIEEGTLGLLEAMACGIPVITTPSGEAKDIIRNGENGILVDFENYESLKNGIRIFFGMSLEEKNKMRQKAWDTVRDMSKEIMARKYEKLYYRTVYQKDLVSVIIPTYKRENLICNVLNAYKKQSYKPIELIVVNDALLSDTTDETERVIEKWCEENPDVPVKFSYTNYDGYGLAMARNMGIFEAGGHYIVFNDDRLIPDADAVEEFVKHISRQKNLVAVWGDKGAGKRNFIENFFIIRKKHIVQAGMFNERIDMYGGMSQEIRDRLNKQGFKLEYEPRAIAKPQVGTHSKSKKRYEIFNMKLKLWKLSN